MGCGGIARLSDEQLNLAQQLEQARKEREAVLEDRDALGLEVKQLRAHVAHMVSENEVLKQKGDKVVSNHNPEIFEASGSEDEVIANWIEMDLRDGDNLLEALKGVHPPSIPEIEQMQAMSSSICQTESSLQEYCNYFESRFKLYNEIWRKVVQVHFDMDESFKNIREVLAGNVISIEPMIGKKSAAMDELRIEIQNLFKMTYADFMNEQRRLETKITGLKLDYYNKRVEDKEAEKQKIIARNEADVKAMKARNQSEMDHKNAEMESMRKSMQQNIDDLLAELKREKDSKSAFENDLRDLHAGNLRKMKRYLKNELKRLAGEMRGIMDGFGGEQQQAKQNLLNFCNDTLGDTMKMMNNYEKRIADLNLKHKQEKALMRKIMRQNLETFRGDFTNLTEEFHTYRRQAEATLLQFCDLTTDKKNQIISEYKTTIQMLHEDVRAEIRKRDQETADLKAFYEKQKATMRHIMKTNTLQFKEDFSKLSQDFKHYQRCVENEMVIFCDMKTDQFVNNSRDSTFLMDQTHRMYLTRINVMKEDLRCEIAKRDRETADMKAHHAQQKALMRSIMSKQTKALRDEMTSLSNDFKSFQKQAETAIARNMHVHHDIHIFDLRSEGVANEQMLMEEHRSEIIKRDAEKAGLIGDYKYRIMDLERQLENATGVIKEDAWCQIRKIDERNDAREHSKAKELEGLIATYTNKLDSTFSKTLAVSTSTLVPLSEFKLTLPDAAIIDSTEPEPLMGGSHSKKGAQIFDQTMQRLKSTLSKGHEETCKVLEVWHVHEAWLVYQWLSVEHTRATLHSTWVEDSDDFRSTINQLKKELKDFGDHHGSVSTEMKENIRGLEDTISRREETIRKKEEAIDGLNKDLEKRMMQISYRDTTIDTMKNDMIQKEAEIIKLKHEMQEHRENSKKEWEDSQDNIERLRDQIRANEDKYKHARKLKIHKRMITDFMRKVQMLKRTFIVQWRLRVTGFAPPAEPAPIEMDSDETDNDQEMDMIEEFIQEDKRLALENNVMVETFRKAESTEKPLTIPQALKFLEEMMDRKYDTDLGDIKNQRPLRTLPNFFLEYTSRTFGLKKLAVKMLCQILPTLEIMNNEGNPYCQLFCRLVQVNNPDPVPFQLAIFLTRVRVEFTPLSEKYSKDKEARDSKRGVKQAGKSKEKGTSMTGGEAYVLDLIAFVYSIFEGDRKSGELMLKMIQPEGVEMYDYVIFKVCHKMAKLGLNAEGIYNILDREGVGSISEIEFIRSARRNLELWISAEDLSLVFKTMAGGARQLAKDTFLGRINFKAYLENCRNDLYIVTRCNFLLSLIEVYHSRQKRDGAFVKGIVGTRKVIPLDVFEGLVKRIDPTIGLRKIQTLYNEALRLSPEPEQGASVGGFVRVILLHPIGSLKNSPFCKSVTQT